MTKKTINHFLVYLAIDSFFHSMMWVTYTLFLKEHGLSYLQMGIVNACFMFCVFLFEMPTGIFADIFGRKYSLVIGNLVFSIAFVVYYFSTTFWGFIIAEIIAAISVTFLSGALDAWLKDALDYHAYKGSLTRVVSRGEIVRNMFVIIGSLTGAYIGQFDLAKPWLIAGFGSIFAGLYIWLFFREDYFTKQEFRLTNSLQKISQHTLKSVNYSLKNKVVLLLICLDFGLVLCFQAPNMYWAITLEKYMKNVFQISQVWILIPILILVGGYISGYLDKFYKEKRIILLSVLIIGLGLLITSQCHSLIWMVIFFSSHEMGRGMINPVRRAYINKHIPSKERATILSFDAMISCLGAALGLLLGGIIAQYLSISISWLVASLVILALLVIVFFLPNSKQMLFLLAVRGRL